MAVAINTSKEGFCTNGSRVITKFENTFHRQECACPAQAFLIRSRVPHSFLCSYFIPILPIPMFQYSSSFPPFLFIFVSVSYLTLLHNHLLFSQALGRRGSWNRVRLCFSNCWLWHISELRNQFSGSQNQFKGSWPEFCFKWNKIKSNGTMSIKHSRDKDLFVLLYMCVEMCLRFHCKTKLCHETSLAWKLQG